MCSFLHVFLGFIVLFTIIKDSVTQYDYTKESAQGQSKSQTQLVFTQTGLDQLDQTCIEKDLENFESTSQPRSFFPYPDQQSNESSRGRPERHLLPVEVQLRAYQQEVGSDLCSLLGKLDRRHSPSHSSKKSGCPRLEYICVGRQCELGFQQIHQSVIYQVPAGWRFTTQPSETNQERQREGAFERKERSIEGDASGPRQSDRANFTLSTRRWICPLDAHGRLPVWINFRATSEPICTSDASQFEQREARTVGPSSEGLSGPGIDAGGNQTADSQDRARDRKDGDQELTSSHKTPGQSEKTPWRSGRSAQSSQITLDGSSLERHQALGETTRGLSKTSSHAHRVGRQSPIRNFGDKSNYPTIEQRHGRRIPSTSTASGRSGRSARGPGGQRGGDSAKAIAGNPPKLRKLFGVGLRSTEVCGDPRCRRHRRRGPAFQTATCLGTLWTICQAVIIGRDNGVQRNPLHEAYTVQSNASVVEAYQIASEQFGAAGDWWDAIPSCLLSWKHSIMDEARFVSPFQASLNALSLQWEVGLDLLPSQPFHHSSRHSASSTLDSSHRSHSKSHAKRQVRFADQIDVFLGVDDAFEMSCLRVAQGALFDWLEKPWSKKRIRSKEKHHIVSLAPLSQVAVLSRDLEPDLDYETFSMVQTIQSKHDIHNEHDASLIDAFSGGQTGTDQLIPPNHDDETSMSDSMSDGAPATSAASSHIRPPSSVGDRQEVVMFHMQDPPLRAFLDWSSYDNMINEIAGHYATIVENVVDAYEINADLQGIPQEAVPIIVHLFPDIAVAHEAKLALFDVEIHAHSSEAGFRLGPKIQRYVLPVPEWLDRASVLTMANADIYCHRERDRCFVWHGNQRWPDTDLQARLVAHGDYFRVAIPPTERFTCATQQMLEWTQNGLHDEEILHILTDQDAYDGYSPSLLDEDEVRQLATRNIEELVADHFTAIQTSSERPKVLQDITNFTHFASNLPAKSRHDELDTEVLSAMQSPATSEVYLPNVDALSGSNSSGDRHITEWSLDLTRLAQQHARDCTTNRDEADNILFSVYTWFIDHQSQLACFQPRIAFLGEDPSEWEEDLTFPWRHHIISDEPLFMDVVSPFTPRAEVEEHIAHVLLSQRVGNLRSILVSLEFIAPVAPSVIVRGAIAVPNPCTRQDIGRLFPLFARFEDEQLIWQHPVAHLSMNQLATRNGMGIMLQVLPEPETPREENAQELNSLIQIAVTNDLTVSKGSDIVGIMPEPTCSFTDEFLEAISAAEEAVRMEPPARPFPNEEAGQQMHEAFRVLLDRFAEEVIPSSVHTPRMRRVESWFLDHTSFTRCHSSRISLLQEDVATWRHTLPETWRERISDPECIDFHVVNPTTEDAAVGTIGQLMVTQSASFDLRSTVLSVYDSDQETERSPYTFALVMHRRLNLERLLTALQLTSDCPPANRQNHCSLWFGRLPIDDSLVVNVHMGQAFRLVIGRGISINVAQLLQMDDVMLRDTLQRSVSTEIFIRPPEPEFLHPDNEALPSRLPSVIPDGRPGWIAVLQQHFDRFHWRDTFDGGPYLMVMVWYLNAHPHFHCGTPHATRLSDDPLIWRAELMASWRDNLQRASPADFFVFPGVLTGIYGEAGQQEVHVFVHQSLQIDSHVVLITVRGVAALQVRSRRFAHVLRSREPVRAILRLAVPDEHAHRPAIVQYEGCTYLLDEQVLLHTGSHLVVEILPHAIDSSPDQGADDVSLFQQVVTCKPADFQEPDDFPVSLPTSHLPRRARPRHDGEFEWSLRFGHLMQQHGELDSWSDTLSMEVTTWYVDHLRSPTCHIARNIRMSGHAITWIEDLRNLWADRLDPTREFSIYLVQPRPPQFRVQRVACHFLLEQGRTPGHEALVLTALLEGYTNEGIIQGAFSMNSRTNLPDVVRTMEIAHFCAGRRCTIVQHPNLIDADQWFDVVSGQSVRIRIEPLEERPEDFDIDAVHFEDLSLMQMSACSQLNPDAAPFVPGQAQIAAQPEALQDIHTAWESFALQREQTPRAASFLTWFVSPGTGLSRCQSPRRVILFADFLQWWHIFRQAWSDLMDPGATFEIVLVHPAPLPLEEGIAGHVILIQHPIDTMSALLVNLKDVAVGQGHPNRLVVSVPETITKRDLLQSVGYERDCHLQGASCLISTAQVQWDTQSRWPARDGDCFYIQIKRAFLPSNWQPPLLPMQFGADGLNLLQLKTTIAKRPVTHSGNIARRSHRHDPSRLLLIAWYVDEDRPLCRMPKTKEVDDSDCLAKQAEQLWADLLQGRDCHVFATETMSRCSKSEHELEEVCFVLDGRPSVPDTATGNAILLERVLDAGDQQLVEHFAALTPSPCSPMQLWKHVRGRSGDPIPEATTCFLQGRRCEIGVNELELPSGCCVSFWLKQNKLAEQYVRITFQQVIIAFEWLDAHFFLPRYDLPSTFPLLPVCYEWIRDWWEPHSGGTSISIYFDGSFVSTAEGIKAGAAAAAFIFVQNRWLFAGALSTTLSNAKTSYHAELSASIIATKFAYDLLKLISTMQDTAQVDVHFCYDSLTTGKQTAGEWQSVSSPISGHLLRSLHKCIHRRFCSELKYQHVYAHRGEPGNELVDTLAHQAALGSPLHELESWVAKVTTRAFVSQAEWFWFLFRTDVSWDQHDLLLPAAPSTLPDLSNDAPAPSVGHGRECAGEIALALTTCNVLTLVASKQKGQQAYHGPARQESVFKQMAEEQIHIFALQETRQRQMSNTHDPRFWLYRAAATSSGHYGVLIGLTRTQPIGCIYQDGVPQKVLIEQKDVSVIVADPRFLLLRLSTRL